MKAIKNTRGEIYVMVCVFVLIVMTVFSVIFTYASVITTVKIQKTNTQIVFDSFVANNSIIIFNNIKQGKNATDGINTAPFYTSLKQFCTLDERNGKLYSMDTDETEKFSLTIPDVGFIEGEKLELYVSFIMYVPIRFAGQKVKTAKVPVRITSALTSKK